MLFYLLRTVISSTQMDGNYRGVSRSSRFEKSPTISGNESDNKLTEQTHK